MAERIDVESVGSVSKYTGTHTTTHLSRLYNTRAFLQISSLPLLPILTMSRNDFFQVRSHIIPIDLFDRQPFMTRNGFGCALRDRSGLPSNHHPRFSHWIEELDCAGIRTH